MKNKKTYQEHLQALKDKKEILPLHKMDDVSRRQFIQSVGIFMAALTVPSIIRLETMSKISRKVFGSSLAYAANPYSSGDVNITIDLRSGFRFTDWIGGTYGRQTNIPSNANLPWNSVDSSTVSGSQTLVLPPGSPLGAFAKGIINVEGSTGTVQGHSPNFNGTFIAGQGEKTAWRAFSESTSGATTLLKQPFFFGDTTQFSLQNVPVSLTPYAPIAFKSINDAINTFKPIDMITNQNTTLSTSIKNSLMAAIGSQFSTDIMAGVKETGKDAMVAANQQSLDILQKGYYDQLNPANPANSATVTMLKDSLPTPGNANMAGVNPAEAIFVIMQAATLGISPMIGSLGFTTGDYHAFIAQPSGSFSTDPRSTTGFFLAQLAANLCKAASGGAWKNRDTGSTQHVKISFASEFVRTVDLGSDNADDGDGAREGMLCISSNVNQTAYKAGSYGGTEGTTGKPYGFANGVHATTIPMFTAQQMLGLRMTILKIDQSGLGFRTPFTGIPELAS